MLRIQSAGVPGALLLAACLAACREGSRIRTIGPPREVPGGSVAQAGPLRRATAGERFGLRVPQKPAAPELAWDPPPGWTVLAPTALRAANFRVAGAEGAECYLTLLAGDAGGLAANVNRWRGQMSQPPAPGAEVAALPRGQLFDREAALVDIAGTWTGMSGGEGEPGFRLIGLLLVDPAGSAFLKMVGPEEVVAGELDAFRALARSFRIASAPAAGGSAQGESSSRAEASAQGIAWRAPAGWRRAPDRATRLASFTVGGDESLECYVTVLAGDAGGPLANVNRWRAQMGREALSAAELAGLSRIPMLGAEGLLVEIESAFGAGGEEQVPEALLLGAVCALPERSVFVKLAGPRGRVEPERDAFRAFCSSLAPAE